MVPIQSVDDATESKPIRAASRDWACHFRQASTSTLSDPKLKLELRLFHPLHVARLVRKQQGGEDFLHDGAHRGKREPRSAVGPHPLALNVGMRDGSQDDVMMSPRIRSAFEVVEAQLALEFLVLLLDRPPLMRQGHQGAERGRGGQIDEVVLHSRFRGGLFFAPQPNLGCETGVPPVVGRGHAHRGESGGARRRRSIAPRDAAPVRRRQLGGPIADRDRADRRHHRRAGARTAAPDRRRRRQPRAGGEDGQMGGNCPRDTATAADARPRETRSRRRIRRRRGPPSA